MKYKNLPASLKYGEIYNSKEVNDCGNVSVDPDGNKHYRLESIDINKLKDRIHENRIFGWAFKNRSSNELNNGAGKENIHPKWKLLDVWTTMRMGVLYHQSLSMLKEFVMEIIVYMLNINLDMKR